MKVNLEHVTQGLKDIVVKDHIYTGLFERINYADTLLPYNEQ